MSPKEESVGLRTSAKICRWFVYIRFFKSYFFVLFHSLIVSLPLFVYSVLLSTINTALWTVNSNCKSLAENVITTTFRDSWCFRYTQTEMCHLSAVNSKHQNPLESNWWNSNRLRNQQMSGIGSSLHRMNRPSMTVYGRRLACHFIWQFVKSWKRNGSVKSEKHNNTREKNVDTQIQ